jgi:Zn-dependent protease
MNLFRIRGIQLQVHFTFFALLAVAGLAGWADAEWNGLLWSVATVVAVFTCVVLHELGHSFTAMHYGIDVNRILLLPIGGMAEFAEIPREPRREILMTIAGPAVNFVLLGLLWLLPHHATSETTAILSLDDMLEMVSGANLVMGCFNFLPAFPMDGGRILRALLTLRMPYVRATFWAATVGKVLAGVGAVCALCAPLIGLAEDPLYVLAALFAFIIVVGEVEYRAVKEQEAQQGSWLAAIDRLQRRTAVPVEEPPALAP